MTRKSTFLQTATEFELFQLHIEIQELIYTFWSQNTHPFGDLSGPWGGKSDVRKKLIYLTQNVFRTALHSIRPGWECDLDMDDAGLPDGLLLACSQRAARVPIRLKHAAVQIGQRWLPLNLTSTGGQIVDTIAGYAAHFFVSRPARVSALIPLSEYLDGEPPLITA